MKEFRETFALLALMTCVVSYIVFVVSVIFQCYDNMIWTGATSFIAFAIFLVAAGDMDNDTYLKNTNQDD